MTVLSLHSPALCQVSNLFTVSRFFLVQNLSLFLLVSLIPCDAVIRVNREHVVRIPHKIIFTGCLFSGSDISVCIIFHIGEARIY